MFPTSFQYRRAETLQEALRLFESCQDAKYLAGGHSLIPVMKQRLAQPDCLIDIGSIEELASVEDAGDAIRVGALVTHARLSSDPLIDANCALLQQAAAQIGDPQVRNKGTIGGNLAHADPASDLPGVMLALEARIHLAGPGGKRSIPASEFFLDLFTTAMQEGEILAAVEMGKRPEWGNCYLKFEHPASGYAVCGAACSLRLGPDGECRRLNLAFNGVSAVPFAAGRVAEVLTGSRLSDEEIKRAVEEHLQVPEPLNDSFASGPYRAQMARVYARRVLAAARNQMT
ncbi:MAG TPA: xanthine dehydrogenase family protein subunit M [Acidobacteriota bacterium]|nr:xanthine dehydrogenase family protein subunit M [Acidobacteriota bacterium]